MFLIKQLKFGDFLIIEFEIKICDFYIFWIVQNMHFWIVQYEMHIDYTTRLHKYCTFQNENFVF